MARLPTVEDMGARPAPSPDLSVAPVSGGTSIAREIGGIGDALMAIDRELTERRRGAELTDTLAKATEEIGTKAIEFQRDQDFKTAPARFKTLAGEIGSKYANQIADPKVRQVFGQQFGQLAVAKQLGVVQNAAKQEGDYYVSSLDANLDKFAQTAALSESALERQLVGEQAKTSIEEMRAGGWITDVQARKFNDKFQQSYFTTMRTRDPVAALNELMDSRKSMDPLLAANLQNQLFAAAQQPMAIDLLASIRFNPEGLSVPPPAFDEALPGLKAAIMKRESGGDPNAVSPQGARGAMQIMPDTFKQYAAPGESFDDEGARVRAAERKIEDDYRFYKGDVRKVAAAYLGGRGAVAADGKIRNDVTDALGTTPAAYAEQVSAMVGAARQYALNSAVASPEGLIQEYLKDPTKKTGNALVDSLPSDQKLAILRTAQTLASQDMAQYKQATMGQYKDTIAAYERGLTPPNPTTPEQLIQAAGPVEGVRLAADQANAQQYGQMVKQANSMPASQLMQTFNESKPTPGPGFADAQRRQEQFATASAAILKERQKDPSGFVLQSAPPVKAAFDNMMAVTSGNASDADKAYASQQYAAATLAEQTRLEIGGQKILTQPMIDKIASEFAKPQAPNTANIIDGLANQWGPHFPQVMKELKKSLPPNAITIGLGMKPEAAQLLSEAMKATPEQLRQGVQDTDLKDIEALITTKLEPFNKTVAFQEGHVETYDAYADSAKSLTLMLMKQGMSKKDAVAKAVDSMLDYKYDFVDTMRVPKAVLGGATTVTNLKTGADAALREMTNTISKFPFMVPLAPTAVRGEDAAKQWKRSIEDNALWVTSPGDSGLTLYVKSGMGAQAVLGQNGKPVSFTWDQLTKLGTSQMATFLDPTYVSPITARQRAFEAKQRGTTGSFDSGATGEF